MTRRFESVPDYIDATTQAMTARDYVLAFNIAKEACEEFRQDYRSHLLMANYLCNIGQYDAARRGIDRLTLAAPLDPNLMTTRLMLEAYVGDLGACQHWTEQAVSLFGPDSNAAKYGLLVSSDLLLQRGEWQAGFLGQEIGNLMRRRSVRYVGARTPAWDGSPNPTGTLFVYHDNGIGDTIMFARFLPRIKEQWQGKVLLHVQPALLSWAKEWPGADVVDGRDDALWTPQCDAYVSVMSLGQRSQAATDADVRDGSILSTPEPIELPHDKLNVAICWHGGDLFGGNYWRSIDWRSFVRLLGVEGVRYYSVQQGPLASECRGVGVVRADRKCKDFRDTCRWLKSVDLVISVDTSVLNAAGAVGANAWGLLWNPTEWRWGLPQGTGGVWYPTVRTFWLKRQGVWSALLDTVRSELEALANSTMTSVHA